MSQNFGEPPAVAEARAKLATEIEQHRERARTALRDAVRKTLSTSEGRRVWIWMQDEVCRLRKAAPAGHPSDVVRFEGRRDVALDLDLVLNEFPESRVALARERDAMAVDEAAHDAAVQRLKAERATK